MYRIQHYSFFSCELSLLFLAKMRIILHEYDSVCVRSGYIHHLGADNEFLTRLLIRVCGNINYTY